MFGFGKKKDDFPEDLPFNEHNNEVAKENLAKCLEIIEEEHDELVAMLSKSIKEKIHGLKNVVFFEDRVAKRFLKELRIVMLKQIHAFGAAPLWNWGVMLPWCIQEAIRVIKSIYGYSDAWTLAIAYPLVSIFEKRVAPLYKARR